MVGGMFPMNPEQLSPDNILLTLSFENSNNSRTFQCIFHLRRCRVCPAMSYRGPLEQLHIFGKRCFELATVLIIAFF